MDIYVLLLSASINSLVAILLIIMRVNILGRRVHFYEFILSMLVFLLLIYFCLSENHWGGRYVVHLPPPPDVDSSWLDRLALASPMLVIVISLATHFIVRFIWEFYRIESD